MLSISAFGSAVGQTTATDPSFEYYKDPGVSANRAYLNQSPSEHIDPFSGRLQLHANDLQIPGNGGLTLAIQRSYTNVDDTTGGAHPYSPYGVGWTIQFGRVLTRLGYSPCDMSPTSGAKMPVLELPDGSRQTLYRDNLYVSGTRYLSTQRWRVDCISAASGGGFRVFSPDGTRYDMTEAGIGLMTPAGQIAYQTKTITNRNGNTLSIVHNSSSRLPISISSSDGRSITLTYSTGSTPQDTRLATISDGSRTWSYGLKKVDGNWYLTTVTTPENKNWIYTYGFDGSGSASTTPGWYSVKSVQYPQGGKYTYGYSKKTFYGTGTAGTSITNTVVTTKTSTLGGAWSFSYTPATSAGAYDVTTANTPSGTITYKHYGLGGATSGNFWKVGLLAEKQIGSEQSESYTWQGQQISTQSYARPGVVLAVDATTNAPRLTQKVITRNGGSYSTTYSSFDNYGNPQTISESSNGHARSTALTYQVNTSIWILHQEKNRSFDGYAITRNIDTGNGNVDSETKFGVTTQYGYDAQGNLSSLINARGKQWQYLSYYRGTPRTEIHPEGVTITRGVSSAGNIDWEKDGEGHQIAYTYDGLNRVKTIDYPTGNDVSIIYNLYSTTLTRGGYSETHNYDGLGRIASINRPGATTTFGHDALNRRTFESYPGSGLGTTTGYDILNRVKTISHGDGTQKSFVYGNHSMTQTNERGITSSYGYRALGDPDQSELMSISYADASLNQVFGRNALGQLLSVTQGGLSRGYTYYATGFLQTLTEPETGTTTFGRDAVGNMTSRQLGSTPATTFGYDDLNRLTTITYPAGTPSVTKGYYKDNQPKFVSNGSALREYTYDANKNLKTEKITLGSRIYNIGYDYSGNDGLDRMTYPSGLAIDYATDALRRPSKAAPFVTGVSYHPNSEPNTLTYANGVITTTSLHPTRQWPQSIQAVKGSTNIMGLSYGYDGLANVTSQTDANDPANTFSNATYDAVDRLMTINAPTAQTFTYDGSGNIKTRSAGAASFTYNYNASSNKLETITGSKNYSFTYDGYGNVSGNGFNTFVYNDASQLAQVVGGATYTYDGNGQRTTAEAAGKKTYYVYARGGNLLAEEVYATDGAPISTKEFAYLHGKQIAVRQDLDPQVISTLSMGLAPAAPTIGQAVTLTANVTGYLPTGTVSFYDNGGLIATVPVVGGVAVFNGYVITAGAHSFTASYSGNPKNTASNATGSALSVSKASPVLSLGSAPAGTLRRGDGVTLTTLLSYAYAPTGSVSFSASGTPIGTAGISGNTAQLNTNQLPLGNLVLTASYPGDGNNQAATSAGLNITVQKALSSIALSATPPGNPQKGKPLTLTANVSGYQPSGSVVFKLDGVALGSALPLSSGSASFVTSSLPVGKRSLTVEYSGDTQNEASTASLTLNVVDVGALMPILQLLLED